MKKSPIKEPTCLRELLGKYRLETGFSMLEAVVVVGVLLALAVGGLFAYGPITVNAKRAGVKSAASEIHTAVLVASIDGDSSTQPQDVIHAYNDSTNKVEVKILSSEDVTSTNGDLCVQATNVEDPSITAQEGTCSDVNGDGDLPGPNPINQPAIMVSTWDTSLAGCSTITLPVNGTVDGTIDWGDGTTASLTTFPSHTYSGTPGPVNVGITGTFTGWGGAGGWTPACITNVTNWSNTGTTSLAFGFYTASKLVSVPQIPEGVTDMTAVFYNSRFNGDISGWDTSRVTNMMYMFILNPVFNQNIGNWDTSNVTNMAGMFMYAPAFNQNIGNWNTSKVTDMSSMFANNSTFNQNISSWDISNVTTMRQMFNGASVFNQNIGNWNTSKVTDMWTAFANTNAFNQNLNSWNTSNVTNMGGTFESAIAFNGEIDEWDTSKVTDMPLMFSSATSFTQDLSGWNVTTVTWHGDFNTNSALTPAQLPHFTS